VWLGRCIITHHHDDEDDHVPPGVRGVQAVRFALWREGSRRGPEAVIDARNVDEAIEIAIDTIASSPDPTVTRTDDPGVVELFVSVHQRYTLRDES
jgi:hypothetical protein